MAGNGHWVLVRKRVGTVSSYGGGKHSPTLHGFVGCRGSLFIVVRTLVRLACHSIGDALEAGSALLAFRLGSRSKLTGITNGRRQRGDAVTSTTAALRPCINSAPYSEVSIIAPPAATL